ncbi:hypothetical protein A359_04760 [secondary endosymbiont of Ctenarytaina eucalypti]|uniref:Uncharacterized protein n=1 Tax=secondary endosymbiont of Ctenarytaina eucalypti TaxID=1199245 RepID=J3Z3T1_9ENTR|nr:hypothetical protein A359_04760 [secondary endosymbiont of Ctenarytaina eucalypti]
MMLKCNVILVLVTAVCTLVSVTTVTTLRNVPITNNTN